jgi:hypothetical protein
MYKNINANVIAGRTQPIMGMKIEGKNEAAIVNIPVQSHYNSK